MFCDRCGTSLVPTVRFCPTCGKSFAPLPPARVPVPRVAGHIRTLAVLWIVYSAIHLLPGLLLSSMPQWFPYDAPFPFFFRGIFRMVSGILLVKGALGIIAGWGLLERQS